MPARNRSVIPVSSTAIRFEDYGTGAVIGVAIVHRSAWLPMPHAPPTTGPVRQPQQATWPAPVGAPGYLTMAHWYEPATLARRTPVRVPPDAHEIETDAASSRGAERRPPVQKRAEAEPPIAHVCSSPASHWTGETPGKAANRTALELARDAKESSPSAWKLFEPQHQRDPRASTTHA
jgi:hypothetical protein